MFREAELKERKKRIEPLTVGQIERYRREKERDGLNEVLLNWMEGAWRACPVVHNRRGKKYPRLDEHPQSIIPSIINRGPRRLRSIRDQNRWRWLRDCVFF